MQNKIKCELEKFCKEGIKKSELDKINPNGSSISIQRQVASLQTKLRRLQGSGLPMYEKDGATIEMWQRYLGKLK